MLSRLHLQNFTVFADADFQFSPGLNVLVGTNGTGKSHVLKAGYAMEKMSYAESNGEQPSNADFLLRLFLADSLLNLVSRGHQGSARIVGGPFDTDANNASLRISDTQSEKGFNSVGVGLPPQLRNHAVSLPLFIPPKEVLTLMPDVAPLTERFKIRLDSTYLDFWKQLQGPALLELPEEIAKVVALMVEVVGGQLEAERGYFYLVKKDGTRLPVALEAEGLRKLAALATILSNGALTPETTLFWDEPEANLNPALLKKLAQVLAELARQGFQIILATHSLFLMKELHILSRKPDAKPLPIRYFSLSKTAEPNAPVTVAAADELIQLPDVAALNAELDQTFDFEVALHGSDAHD